MKIKTEGKCIGCQEKCTPRRGINHLPKCEDVLQSLRDQKLEKGYLVRVSWVARPDMYWMLVAVANSLTLGDLDYFLRQEWLECCGHLSAFTIGERCYKTYDEMGGSAPAMEKQVKQMFSPGLKIEYLYDMGSSTELVLQVLDVFEACPQEGVTILMQNEQPLFPCEICKEGSEIICCLCGKTTCERCSEKHSCVEEERDTYMLMRLVNSPRSGVCAYEGKSACARW